ncbi:hypothetical protein E4U58_005429 [Claviceps cyperi]|nr:hypothetical protein E4U58_005429 [Claviceps cyperi]
MERFDRPNAPPPMQAKAEGGSGKGLDGSLLSPGMCCLLRVVSTVNITSRAGSVHVVPKAVTGQITLRPLQSTTAIAPAWDIHHQGKEDSWKAALRSSSKQ